MRSKLGNRERIHSNIEHRAAINTTIEHVKTYTIQIGKLRNYKFEHRKSEQPYTKTEIGILRTDNIRIDKFENL